jgi:5-carboxymethyl-2-hydroxymuconate isomerase
MPHCIIEYSEEIDQEIEIKEIISAVFQERLSLHYFIRLTLK